MLKNDGEYHLEISVRKEKVLYRVKQERESHIRLKVGRLTGLVTSFVVTASKAR